MTEAEMEQLEYLTLSNRLYDLRIEMEGRQIMERWERDFQNSQDPNNPYNQLLISRPEVEDELTRPKGPEAEKAIQEGREKAQRYLQQLLKEQATNDPSLEFPTNQNPLPGQVAAPGLASNTDGPVMLQNPFSDDLTGKTMTSTNQPPQISTPPGNGSGPATNSIAATTMDDSNGGETDSPTFQTTGAQVTAGLQQSNFLANSLFEQMLQLVGSQNDQFNLMHQRITDLNSQMRSLKNP